MPILSKKAFAAALHIREGDLSNLYGRSKFAYVGDVTGKTAQIDTDAPINAAFIQKRVLYLAKEGKEVIINGIPVIPMGQTAPPPEVVAIKPEKVKLPPKEPKQPYITTSPIPIADFDEKEPVTAAQVQNSAIQIAQPTQSITVNLQNNNKNEQNVGFFQLDQQLKQQELEKKFEETEILKLKKNKTQGVLIPTEAVSVLVSETLRIFSLSYRDMFERDIQMIAAKYGLSAKELAHMRKSGIDSMNVTYNESIDRVKVGLVNIIKENSDKRSVGEKA